MTKEQIGIEVLRRLAPQAEGITAQSGDVMIKCPFHTDNTPSCSVNVDKFCYVCFSCQRHGTLAEMYYEKTGSSIYRELSVGSSRFSVPRFMQRQTDVVDFERPPKVNFCIKGDAEPVESSPEALAYLQRRGVSVRVAVQMGFRYARSLYTAPVDTSLMTAEQVRKSIIYFTGRVIIPVYEKGKLMSVEGRSTETKKEYIARTGTAEGFRKVLYPKGSSMKTLFSLDLLDLHRPLYIMEGLMDLAVLREDPFFDNSTAFFGANITPRQQYLLKKFDELVFLNDNDFAGWTSAYNLYKSTGKDFFVLPPPPGRKDVGEILGADGMSAVADARSRHWLDGKKRASSINWDAVLADKKAEHEMKSAAEKAEIQKEEKEVQEMQNGI